MHNLTSVVFSMLTYFNFYPTGKKSKLSERPIWHWS